MKNDDHKLLVVVAEELGTVKEEVAEVKMEIQDLRSEVNERFEKQDEKLDKILEVVRIKRVEDHLGLPALV